MTWGLFFIAILNNTAIVVPVYNFAKEETCIKAGKIYEEIYTEMGYQTEFECRPEANS